MKYSCCDPGNWTTTIPRRNLKTGSRCSSVQYFVSRTDARNASGLSGSKNAVLIHFALYAGGIVGSSFHSAARGFPTGSAALLGHSMNAFSSSQANSASASFTSSLPAACAVVVALSALGDLLWTIFVSLTGLGVCWRELEADRGVVVSLLWPCPRWLLSLLRRLFLFLPPLSRSLRRSRWSLFRECP